MKLNLGHTIGHGVEACSHFAISHGKGVATGMAIVARAAAKCGICDDATRDAIVNILEKFQLAPYFDLICGASMDDTRDSKDKVIAYLLEKTGGKDDYIMVGDTAYDVEGAAVNGIPTIGVAWGYGKVEDMRAAGAKAIAYSPAELLQMLL
jgi:phosphoglycolate phosphatase